MNLDKRCPALAALPCPRSPVLTALRSVPCPALTLTLIEVKSKVDKIVEETEVGCEVKTGTMDGWDNSQKVHWLAKMGITRKGPFFKGAIDTTGVDTMDADWTFQQLEDLIGELGGVEVVAAMVLDGPNVNKSALKKMEEKYPTVVALLCLCHCIAIFFKNVFKLTAADCQRVV